MSILTINDLEYDRELDRAAMSAIGGGGGAPWVYGWMTPYVSEQRSQQGFGGGIVNIYDISNIVTNNVSVGQMINQ
ncbi:hypothetical protein BVER_01267c [Candidatus Burkholderia verschuerenii]|uniref:Uncharacterized protein n=1 Tax=Candidatus Burkholderia verschuerenii TaxID=242163 RepID=A0A0L0MBE9_9BURK|nr:hypothetical protein [Candidatus Burkholderia verschuerenii]KND59575.1 hypothetical protein BVER_01267c [Candidatus Burkholderia verschuerenii]